MGLIATYVAEADRFDLLFGPGSDLQAVVKKNADESWLIRFDEELTRRLSGLPAAISDELADEHNLSLNEVEMLETVLRPLAAEAAAEPWQGRVRVDIALTHVEAPRQRPTAVVEPRLRAGVRRHAGIGRRET